jgi:hypothetical protein
MTIKQQGGIFGRNPTFNDVDVEGDLTSSSVDINGGNIDGTTIGAATPAAGDFTSLDATGEVSGNTLKIGTTSDSNFADVKSIVYGNAVIGGAINYGNLSTTPSAAKASFSGGTTLTFDISFDTVASWRPYFLTLRCAKVSSNGAGLSGAVFDYVSRVYDGSHSTPSLIDSRGTPADFTITFTPTAGDPANLNVSIAQTANWQICEVTVFNYYSIRDLS